MHRRTLIVGLLLLASSREAALAGSYSDPSGFSFNYPDGWVAVNKAALGDLRQVLPQEVKDWLAKNNANLDRVAMILLRQGQEEFLENLNVVVDGQQIPVNSDSVSKITSILPKQYASMGAQVSDIRVRQETLGTREVIVVDYSARLPTAPFPLRQRQYMIPGGGKTFIVTCTARAETFDRYQATFNEIMTGFQAPAPVSSGFDWGRVGQTALIGGLVGGAAAALAGVLQLFRKKKPAPTVPEKRSRPAPERRDDRRAGDGEDY